jgi:hypothetical protein
MSNCKDVIILVPVMISVGEETGLVEAMIQPTVKECQQAFEQSEWNRKIVEKSRRIRAEMTKDPV